MVLKDSKALESKLQLTLIPSIVSGSKLRLGPVGLLKIMNEVKSPGERRETPTKTRMGETATHNKDGRDSHSQQGWERQPLTTRMGGNQGQKGRQDNQWQRCSDPRVIFCMHKRPDRGR